MVKTLSALVFLLGVALIAWMGAGFVHTSPLALLVTLAIGVFYAIGYAELWRYQGDTGALEAALAGAGAEAGTGAIELAPWLGTLPASLRTAVGLRIQGEPVALPAPLLTPYLTGLLVMLGLLGTFVGMMATLQGTVTALEGSTELAAIRAGLAAPIKGLSMAFGTSVAGVGASAALGFISTLSRRQRLAAGRLLEHRAATAFKSHSRTHYREQMLEHAALQSAQLPALVATVEQGLRDSIAAQTAHAAQLPALVARIEQGQRDSIAAQAAHAAQLPALVARIEQGQRDSVAAQAGQLQALVATVEQGLRDSIAAHGEWAADTLKPAIDSTMAGLAAAVADITGELREAVTGIRSEAEAAAQRDLALLEQQRGLLAELTATAEALREEAGQHRASAEALTENAGRLLADTSARFETRVESDSGRLAEVAEHFAASAIELSSLGEALGAAMAQFQDNSTELRATLAQMDAALCSSTQRSDEQMGYYVAQAREVIDHSVLAQQQLIEQLRQLSHA